MEKNLGNAHSYVVKATNTLAQVYVEEGEYAKADPLYTRVLAIRERKLGPNHPDVAASLDNLAALDRKLGKADAATVLETRAKTIRASASASASAN
jgi:hypothetical protein